MTDADLPLDNPMLVQWEFASEERLEKRNALYRRLIEGVNAEDVLFDAVREVSPKRLLDVGCGAGEMAKRIQDELGAEVMALDSSQRMVDLTRERGVEAVLGDIQRLPFADGEFDLVVSFTGLHCFPDPARAVVEMCRVLRLGGVLTGSALLNDTGVRFEPMRRAGRLAGLLGPGCTSDQLRRWLAGQGVSDVTLDVSGAIAYFRGVRRA